MAVIPGLALGGLLGGLVLAARAGARALLRAADRDVCRFARVTHQGDT